MNNSELYQTIERLKVDIRESAKAIDERDVKIDSIQNDVKRALQEKADKESLIKSTRVISQFIYSVDTRELEAGK